MTVELPKDVDGREIPLDTKVLYDANGDTSEVQAFEFSVIDGMWRVQFLGDFIYFYTNDMHLTPPDSWEKLEEDLDKCIETDDTCRYYSESGICAKCTRPDNDGCGCTTLMFSDIKKRIRKLRGED